MKFEQSTALTGLLVEVLSYSTADNIETQASLIKSYPILEEVARRMGRLPQAGGTEAPARVPRLHAPRWRASPASCAPTAWPAPASSRSPRTSTNPLEARDLANTVAEVYRDNNRANPQRAHHRGAQVHREPAQGGRGPRHAAPRKRCGRSATRTGSSRPGAESSVLLSLFTQVRGDIEKARQQRIELEQVAGRLERTDPASVADRVFIDTPNPAIMRLHRHPDRSPPRAQQPGPGGHRPAPAPAGPRRPAARGAAGDAPRGRPPRSRCCATARRSSAARSAS